MSRTMRERAARLAQGRCKYCTGTPHGGTKMCWRHRVYQASWKAAQRLKARAVA